MIAAVAAVLGPHALAGRLGKRLESLRCDARPGAINRFLGPLCVKPGLISRGLQFTNAVLQHGIGQIGDAILDGVIESLELGVRLGRDGQRQPEARVQNSGGEATTRRLGTL